MRTLFWIPELSFDVLDIHGFFVTLEIKAYHKRRQITEKLADSPKRCAGG